MIMKYKEEFTKFVMEYETIEIFRAHRFYFALNGYSVFK